MKYLRAIIAVFAIMIAMYPMVYIVLDKNAGFLSSKLGEILDNPFWMTSFYLHIIFGGVSLLTGWSQFVPKWRIQYLKFHRKLGMIYLISVTIGGLAGFYLALYANGGLVSTFGFGSLAILWLFTTWTAFLQIKNGQISSHQEWMLRSYALTFAAVTLRLWLPALTGLGIEFIDAYKVISWLCWVPNLLLIEWMIRTQAKPG